jgi:hypothetical protein
MNARRFIAMPRSMGSRNQVRRLPRAECTLPDIPDAAILDCFNKIANDAFLINAVSGIIDGEVAGPAAPTVSAPSVGRRDCDHRKG